MASIGIHTNGSQFYIALAPMPQLNGRCVTFARIVKGMDSVAAIEKVSTVHAKNNYTAKSLTRNQTRSAHLLKFQTWSSSHQKHFSFVILQCIVKALLISCIALYF